LAAPPAHSLTAYVTNERDNTMSVVDLEQMKTVQTVPVGQRPRAVLLTRDGTQILVCASDDNIVQVIDRATLKIVGTLPSGPDPENFALAAAAGSPLYVANENDNLVTVIDMATRQKIAEMQTGVEPEGMAVSPDDKTIVNTTETTGMAHFFDRDTHAMTASVLVDPRPRVAEFRHDGSEVWVSAELGGTVSVIDPVVRQVTHRISFDIQGLRREAVQPVGIRFTRDDATAFVALGPANRVAVIETRSYTVRKYLLVGQRVWQMAFTPDEKFLLTTNGLSNDISVVEVGSLTVVKSIPVGRLPWGVAVSPQ
jgi:PQQ-dependent catabolism-associated beta-propeller protein